MDHALQTRATPDGAAVEARPAPAGPSAGDGLSVVDLPSVLTEIDRLQAIAVALDARLESSLGDPSPALDPSAQA